MTRLSATSESMEALLVLKRNLAIRLFNDRDSDFQVMLISTPRRRSRNQLGNRKRRHFPRRRLEPSDHSSGRGQSSPHRPDQAA